MKKEGEDSCHSWVILAACSIINFVTSGLLYGPTGVLYVAYIDTTGSSAQKASWVIALTPAMSIIGGPLGAILSTLVSVRTLILSGIVLGTLGTAAGYLCLDFYYLIITYGLMNGIGTALASTALSALINNAFCKHRDTAMGIFCSATPISGAVMPVITQTLYDQFGLQGTFLILGGIYLQAMIGAMLFADTRMKVLNLSRTPSQEMRAAEEKSGLELQQHRAYDLASQQKDKEVTKHLLIGRSSFQEVKPTEEKFGQELQQHRAYEQTNHQEDKEVTKQLIISRSSFQEVKPTDEKFEEELRSYELVSQQDDKDIVNHMIISSQELKLTNEKFEQELMQVCAHQEVSRKEEKVPVQHMNGHVKLEVNDLHSTVVNVQKPLTRAELNEVIRKRTFRKRVRTYSLTGKGQMVSILKVPGFHLSNFTLVIGNFLCLLFSLITVDNGIQNELDVHQAVHLMTIYAAGQLFGRLVLGWIIERTKLTKPASFTITHLIFSFVCVFFVFAKCFVTLGLLSAISGVILGNLNPLSKVVYSDYLRKDQMVFAMYMSYFMVGVLAVIRSACVGQIKDTYGNYKNVYYFMGAISLMTALVWAGEYCRKRSCQKRSQQDTRICR